MRSLGAADEEVQNMAAKVPRNRQVRAETQVASRERAKKVILEILRQAGGQLGKTKIFKAFWIAHLYYSKKARGYLTDWPIVRMPKGPGIDEGDALLVELLHSGDIKRSYEPRGPFTEINCRLTKQLRASDLTAAAVRAIKSAVDDVKKHTAGSISEWSHEFSRSWNTTPDGEELDIYTDLIPDDTYEERRQELLSLKKAYKKWFR
jgi:hypothetical protein